MSFTYVNSLKHGKGGGGAVRLCLPFSLPFTQNILRKKKKKNWSLSPSEHFEVSVQKPPMPERVKSPASSMIRIQLLAATKKMPNPTLEKIGIQICYLRNIDLLMKRILDKDFRKLLNLDPDANPTQQKLDRDPNFFKPDLDPSRTATQKPATRNTKNPKPTKPKTRNPQNQKPENPQPRKPTC